MYITKVGKEKNKIKIEIDGEYHLFLYTGEIKELGMKELFADVLGTLAKEVKTTTYESDGYWQKKKEIAIETDIELEEDDYNKIKKIVVTRGKKKVFHLLGKQDYAIKKLQQKLEQGGYTEYYIEEILAYFIELGFLNERNLVEARINQYIKMKSKQEVLQTMMRQGFAKEMILEVYKEAIETKEGTNPEEISLEKLFQKKYIHKIEVLKKDISQKQKAMQYFYRKGYPYEMINKVFGKYMER